MSLPDGYLKHEPAGRRGEVQIVTEADKGYAVGVEISERVDKVLQRGSETVNLPAQHNIKATRVSVGHEPIQFRP
jgi:hypothetical protein